MKIELKDAAQDMLDIILDDYSTEDERLAARSTLFEIIAPNLRFTKKGPYGCPMCKTNINSLIWIESEQSCLMVCPNCGEEWLT